MKNIFSYAKMAFWGALFGLILGILIDTGIKIYHSKHDPPDVKTNSHSFEEEYPLSNEELDALDLLFEESGSADDTEEEYYSKENYYNGDDDLAQLSGTKVVHDSYLMEIKKIRNIGDFLSLLIKYQMLIHDLEGAENTLNNIKDENLKNRILFSFCFNDSMEYSGYSQKVFYILKDIQLCDNSRGYASLMLIKSRIAIRLGEVDYAREILKTVSQNIIKKFEEDTTMFESLMENSESNISEPSMLETASRKSELDPVNDKETSEKPAGKKGVKLTTTLPIFTTVLFSIISIIFKPFFESLGKDVLSPRLLKLFKLKTNRNAH